MNKQVMDLLGTQLADMISERINARLGKATDNSAPKTSPNMVQNIESEIELPKGHGAARCMAYLFRANNDAERAISMAMDRGDRKLAEIWGKAMGQEPFSSGGALLPPEFSMEIIAELGAKAVVRQAGPTVLPMKGSLVLSDISSSASASYVGEASNATESTPGTGQIQLSEKTLVALGVLSNQLLANGGPRVENAIKNHLVRILKRKEDVTFLRSVGSANEPTGMYYLALAANRFASAGTSVANITTDLGKAVLKLMEADVDMDGAAWFFSPRTYSALTTKRDGNNNLVWADEMARGTLMGFPYHVTSQIPSNLGGSSDESEVYFAAMPGLVIGEGEQLEVSVHPNGAYHDGSAVVSGVSTYQSPIRIVARHDFADQFRGKSIAVVTGVKWAP